MEGVGMLWVGFELGYVYFVYGDDGFGNIGFLFLICDVDLCSLVEFIVEMVCKYLGEIMLVVIGLLGNIVLVLCFELNLFKLVKGLSIMGGVVFVLGNVILVVEVNIWNDVYVVDIVFLVDWEVKMFGLDVILFVFIDLKFVDVLVDKNFIMGGFV